MTNQEMIETEIVCKEDGPYVVKNLNKLISKGGEEVSVSSTVALCRCGESQNKPYCDGTHAKAGFTSEVQEGRMKNRKRSYQGKSITIHDNRGLCAHAGVCTKNLASVFRMKLSPWIDADQASVNEIKQTIDDCPSGALSYTEHDGEKAREEKIDQCCVSVIPNGPYRITGGVKIEGVEKFDGGSEQTRTLCRCGHSKNKPYCDGSHWDVDFQDS